MLNFIWLALIGLAVIVGGLTGHIGDVGTGAVKRAQFAVEYAGGLLGMMTLWLGLIRLADKAGLVRRVGLALKPVMLWLFPEVPPEHPAMGAMLMNIAANILGLNNAATPMGLRAMNELEKLNPRPGVATNAMCMFLAINTSSVTLIPVTVIVLLAQNHAKNPTAIIGTSLAATAIAHAVAILSCKLLEKSRWSRPAPLVDTPADTAPVTTAETDAAVAEGAKLEQQTLRADESLPWVPGAKWILAIMAVIFAQTLYMTINPERFGWPVSPDFAAESLPRRMVDAVSLLLLPWLIFFFPLYAMLRRIPVYDEFVEGAREGFQVVVRILPFIVGMMVATEMLRAAGCLDLMKQYLGPVTGAFGFPVELLPMVFIRPFSSAAALGYLSDLVLNPAYGPDNIITLTAATLYGCSETTFYVISVYFGSVGVRKTRHAIPAGLIADVTGPIASVIICRAMFS